jgi:tetratricopeptide (TPR) repeat protein
MFVELHRIYELVVYFSIERIHECVGNSYYNNEQYDVAIDCYKKALNILETCNDQQLSMDTDEFNYKIGLCYKMQENIDLFVNHFQIAL